MGLSVLIVDDYIGTALLLNKAFEMQEVKSEYCTSSSEALKLLDKNDYDYVILDILINGDPNNGIMLYDYIHNKFPSMKVVFITGCNRNSEQVLKAGQRAPVVFKRFVLKDFVKDVLYGRYYDESSVKEPEAAMA